MIIVSEQDSWPQEIYRDAATGLTCWVDRGVCGLVADGISKWARKTGHEPTHVLLGPREIRLLKSQGSSVFTMMNERPLIKLIGLKVVPTQFNGLQILGDCE